MCPAGAAVDGYVLISLKGEVVGAIDVSPPVAFGEFVNGYFFELGEDMGLECGGLSVFAVG